LEHLLKHIKAISDGLMVRSCEIHRVDGARPSLASAFGAFGAFGRCRCFTFEERRRNDLGGIRDPGDLQEKETSKLVVGGSCILSRQETGGLSGRGSTLVISAMLRNKSCWSHSEAMWV
jgi:hypothetical protein